MSTVLLSLLFQLAVPAQQTPAVNPADLCTLQGVVIKAGTGEPLHKASVEAYPAGNRQANDQAQGGSAETDPMGRFEIRGLNPGRYYLYAQRNGFVRQHYGQRTPEGQGALLTLTSGQKMANITFQMIPAAVITGHVYDEDGEPVVYAMVSAMHYAYIRGQRQLVSTGAGSTNDLGEFRLFGLSPGQYIIQAAPRANMFENAKNRQGNLPIFYPGVTDASRAAPISVRGGDESSGIDINLVSVRGMAVKGSVSDAGCGTNTRGAMVFLREQNPSQSFGAQSPMRSVNEHSAFEFSNVVPGSYYLYGMVNADGKQCFGRQAVDVADADVEGVSLAVTPGVEIKGRLRIEGQLDANVGSLSVDLAPKIFYVPFAGGRSDSAKSDGTFTIKNASDGDYEINVSNLPDNYFLKAARLDGVDVLSTGITIDTKQAPGSLDVLISPNGASLDGEIAKDQQPFQGATVALVPDPPRRGERRLFRTTTTDQNGHFVLQGLPPGDYKVFAWEKVEAGAITSSEFLQPYEKLGESVHITEGSRNSAQVDLIPANESGP
jgi:protocatechuate 3,4-dioxygenase beta subunit